MTELTSQGQESPDSEVCWALLERIAASPHLRRAPRLREFLFYVGRRALKDGCDQVHEQEIGVEVFGRPQAYDTSVDNIVRANASELRKRIEAYFQSEGAHETLIMEIPRWSYVPVFHHRPVAPQSADPPVIAAVPADPAHARPEAARALLRSVWMLSGWIVALLLAVGCVALWVQNRAMYRLLYPWKYEPAVAALWSGFFDSSPDTDVVMEDSSYLLVQNLGKQAFSFNDYLNRTYLDKLRVQKFSPGIHSAQNLIAGKTLARAAEVRLVQRILALDPLDRNLHLYNAREYTPALLTKDSVILLSNPTSNPWVDLFEDRLNFVEKSNPNTLSPVINRAPAAGEQRVYNSTDTVVYCVVAYLPKSDNSGKMLIVQGTSSEATEAGGNFLLSEDQLSGFQKKLHVTTFPYFEVLLRISHVTGTPITSAIEAYRTYPNLH
ncbi:MAG TPA: hypothetical protein VMV57_04005 [Terracidiphilus sp.]|nr:hypothetical protein [Terracidiphilus sp.]